MAPKGRKEKQRRENYGRQGPRVRNRLRRRVGEGVAGVMEAREAETVA